MINEKTFKAFVSVLTLTVLYAAVASQAALLAVAMINLDGGMSQMIFLCFYFGITALLSIALGALAGCGSKLRLIFLLLPPAAFLLFAQLALGAIEFIYLCCALFALGISFLAAILALVLRAVYSR